MSLAKKLMFAFVFMCILLFFAGVHFFSPGPVAMFEVKEGATGSQIAHQLEREGIISSNIWFRIILKVTGKVKKIAPGRYELRKNMSSEEVFWRLLHTDGKYYVRVLIPEGWRMEQVADRLDQLKVCQKVEFLKAARERNLEGYLFPSTYFFEKNTPPLRVLDTMSKEFDKHIRPLFDSGPPVPGLSKSEVLTIASIVEREAVEDDERPLIAAVYLNRYKQNMKLEADPTVQYALGYWKKRLSFKDLRETNSPYNTYMYQGLPPGPICSPGYLSVKAVFSPAKIDSIYFVADHTGRHVFNTNYSDHLKAIHAIRKNGWTEATRGD